MSSEDDSQSVPMVMEEQMMSEKYAIELVSSGTKGGSGGLFDTPGELMDLDLNVTEEVHEDGSRNEFEEVITLDDEQLKRVPLKRDIEEVHDHLPKKKIKTDPVNIFESNEVIVKAEEKYEVTPEETSLLKSLRNKCEAVLVPKPSQPVEAAKIQGKPIVVCPFPSCKPGEFARYSFWTHLCDRHLKQDLSRFLPATSFRKGEYKCPVINCKYMIRDNRQTLVRHIGMFHRMAEKMMWEKFPQFMSRNHFTFSNNTASNAVQSNQTLSRVETSREVEVVNDKIISPQLIPRLEKQNLYENVCDQCHQVFKYKKSFQNHMKNVHFNKVCEICDQRFYQEKKYETHVESHHHSITCGLCSIIFNDKEEFDYHLRRDHFNEGKCEPCNIHFAQKNSFDSHLKQVHFGYGRDINCDLCKMKFDTIFSLEYHLATIHSVSLGSAESLPENHSIKCGICSVIFNDKETFHNHFGEDHFNEGICELCNTFFEQKDLFESHLKQIHFQYGRNSKATGSLQKTPEIMAFSQKMSEKTHNLEEEKMTDFKLNETKVMPVQFKSRPPENHTEKPLSEATKKCGVQNHAAQWNHLPFQPQVKVQLNATAVIKYAVREKQCCFCDKSFVTMSKFLMHMKEDHFLVNIIKPNAYLWTWTCSVCPSDGKRNSYKNMTELIYHVNAMNCLRKGSHTLICDLCNQALGPEAGTSIEQHFTTTHYRAGFSELPPSFFNIISTTFSDSDPPTDLVEEEKDPLENL